MSMEVDWALSFNVIAHEKDVRCVLAINEKLIASASRDCTISLSASPLSTDGGGTEDPALVLFTLKGHEGFVNAIDFRSKDGLLVSGDLTGVVKFWNISGIIAGEIPDASEDLCIHTFKAHEKNISCIKVALDDEFFYTGSWDSMVKKWSFKGQLSWEVSAHSPCVWFINTAGAEHIVTGGADMTAKLLKISDGKIDITFSQHTTAVRQGIFIESLHAILSMANDGKLLLWDFSGHILMDYTLTNPSFYYSLTLLPDRSSHDSKTYFAVGGEEGVVKIWSLDKIDGPVTTVAVPAIVWSISYLPVANSMSDIICGCSDGRCRVYTSVPSRLAGPLSIAAHQEALSSQSSGFDPAMVEKLPTLEQLEQRRGKHEDEMALVKKDTQVLVYSWREGKWHFVDVATSSSSSSAAQNLSIDGETYDYVFDVELDENGPKAKLGFNKGQHPHAVAQKFIEKHSLNPGALETIVGFLIRNLPASALAQNAPAAPPPDIAALPLVQFPHLQYITYDTSSAVEAIVKKTIEFKGNVSSDERAVFGEISSKLSSKSGLTAAHVRLVESCLVSTDTAFPALDLLRLMVLMPDLSEDVLRIFDTKKEVVVPLLTAPYSASSTNTFDASRAMLYRLVANAAAVRNGKFLASFGPLIPQMLSFMMFSFPNPKLSKRVKTPVAAFLLNLSIAGVGELGVDVAKILLKAIEFETDCDVLETLFLACGNVCLSICQARGIPVASLAQAVPDVVVLSSSFLFRKQKEACGADAASPARAHPCWMAATSLLNALRRP